MIPTELLEKWEERMEREELLFLADHGGGWPDCMVRPSGSSPDDRLRILRQMGFRVADQYDMPSSGGENNLEQDEMEPWCRLTNGVAVNLADGFTVRQGIRGWRK